MGKFSEIAYEMSLPDYDGKYDEVISRIRTHNETERMRRGEVWFELREVQKGWRKVQERVRCTNRKNPYKEILKDPQEFEMPF
tara:strand:- start:463 stop:711 length:249 start_codon:yes stop_codon:yes gene_type:complete